MNNTITQITTATKSVRIGRVRYGILAILLLVSTINYADRATLSMAGTAMQQELGFSAIQLGYLFSAFAWAYAIAQVPSGWLLDKYGSKIIYGLSLILWSAFTVVQGSVGLVHAASAFALLFIIRFLLGLVEAPAFPANGRLVTAWFPSAERGTATAIFNTAQYFSLAVFSPIMAWIISSFGWEYVFIMMGGMGIILGCFWPKLIYSPKKHPRVKAEELDYIEKGGALINLDSNDASPPIKVRWSHVKQLLSNRLLLAAYFSQYANTALTYFFTTWFPIYLVQARGMPIMKVGLVAILPAICGFLGGICCGLLSDFLIRRGASLTVARKTPFVLGMTLASSLVLCNFVEAEWAVIAIMAMAFYGKGLAAIGWAVVSDSCPKELAGLTGGIFNGIGGLAGVVMPITAGYIITLTGSFDGVLIFVAAHAVLAVMAYLLLMGPIRRIELKV